MPEEKETLEINSRDGKSREYDQDGKLTKVDGVAVDPSGTSDKSDPSGKSEKEKSPEEAAPAAPRKTTKGR